MGTTTEPAPGSRAELILSFFATKAKQEDDHGLLITPDLDHRQCESEIFGTDQISEIDKEVEDKKLRMSQVQDELKVEKDEG